MPPSEIREHPALPASKVYTTPAAALADISAGASLLLSGFADCGAPGGLLTALSDCGVGGLTCIYAHAGPETAEPYAAVSRLAAAGQVKKVISPLPFPPGKGGVIQERWQAGDLDIEIVPQGILAERLRAGGAGIGGVFLPTGIDTRFEQGREKRSFPGGDAIFYPPLKADFALLKAAAADTLGSLIYAGSGRNWGPVMAMAARITVAEADRIVEPGGLDPEAIITPGIFVNRIVAARPD